MGNVLLSVRVSNEKRAYLWVETDRMGGRYTKHIHRGHPGRV